MWADPVIWGPLFNPDEEVLELSWRLEEEDEEMLLWAPNRVPELVENMLMDLNGMGMRS